MLPSLRMSTDFEVAQAAVLVPSCKVPDDAKPIKGFDFNTNVSLGGLLESYGSMGFQASNLGRAFELINSMLADREADLQLPENTSDTFPYPVGKRKRGCTIFLGYTSNLVSSGLREVIRFIVQHDLVDCLVTSAGGVEEDLIKCLKPSYLGDFNMDGKQLRLQGLNRAGNILIPNDNYCAFEDWLNPVLDECLKEQNECGVSWTPSRFIHRLGREIANEDSILHSIPVFCPALTDGSLGDMLYFHSVRNSPFIKLDIVEDVCHINTMAVKSIKTGAIILGGGVPKEYDGSDSGARPDEAVSWGKIRANSQHVKVFADATLVFPLVVVQTFAQLVQKRKLSPREDLSSPRPLFASHLPREETANASKQ